MKLNHVIIVVEIKAVGVVSMNVEDMAEMVTVQDVEEETMVEGGMGMTVMEVMTVTMEEIAVKAKMRKEDLLR